jgi:hypothetical protein
MLGGMDNWPSYVQKLWNMLRKGGWAEFHDLDETFFNARGDEISGAWEWHHAFTQGFTAMGLDTRCGRSLRTWMQDAGFVDLEVREYRIPFGGEQEASTKLQGFSKYWLVNMPEVFDMSLQKLESEELLSDKSRERLTENMRRDLEPEPGKHMKLYVVTGRKPE